MNLLGSGVAVIAGEDKARERLAAEPDLWPQAVEELLRLESPVQITGRVARADTEVDGIEITRGMALLFLLGGANRDPNVFANPAAFDLDRPNSRDHVALSAGIHYCLGANLAKMEGQTGLRLLFERFPDLAVVPGEDTGATCKHSAVTSRCSSTSTRDEPLIERVRRCGGAR